MLETMQDLPADHHQIAKRSKSAARWRSFLPFGRANKRFSSSSAGDQATKTPTSEQDQDEAESRFNLPTAQFFESVGASLVLHALIILIMACVLLNDVGVGQVFNVYSSADEVVAPVELLELTVVEPDEVTQTELQPVEELAGLAETAPEPADDIKPNLGASSAVDDSQLQLAALSVIGPGLPATLAGRTREGRAALAAANGGNAASEAAVDLGLEWLKTHQQADGSWSFDHHVNHTRCALECTQPGNLTNCKTGATAMAILCFLGAGYTHEKGEYRTEVQAGIQYLMNVLRHTPRGGDLRGESGYQSMYVQGLAAIALCEAHAMSRPKTGQSAARRSRTASKTRKRKAKTRKSGPISYYQLADAAQYAIDFVMAAQDPKGGGWRYAPRQRGDTSVVGWQLMALQSARFAKLHTRKDVFSKVNKFLSSVEFAYGAQYGYVSSQPNRPGTTAVGLLCRMYLGWDHKSKPLRVGVEYLSDVGPSPDDMYYNYYATQVLHHWGGAHWSIWNETMRDQLVDSQISDGHAAGSWDVRDRHGSAGGRLYMTALCIMTLEVYYRHMPLYDHSPIAEKP
jgi:hypothetical protein